MIDDDGNALGVMSTKEALIIAQDAGLDLVEVSPEAQPPVCKILDYGKFRYQQQKRQAQVRKNQKIIEVKEIVFRPNIEDHDFQVKLKAIRKFLQEGDKVKVTLRFRGRELSHVDIGSKVILKLRELLLAENLCKVDVEPKLEGRHMLMILSPTAQK